MTTHSKKYQALVGCLFDRQLKQGHTTHAITGLIIITDITEFQETGRYSMKARLISTMEELVFDFNAGDLEMFLYLKSGNNSEYDSRVSFTYKYRYIQ